MLKIGRDFSTLPRSLHTLYLSDHVVQLSVNHSLVAEQALKVLFREQEKMVR
jgi:hypothetical protein